MLEIALIASVVVALVGYRIHRHRRSQQRFLNRQGSADPASAGTISADNPAAAVVSVPMREVATGDTGTEASTSASPRDDGDPATDTHAHISSPTNSIEEASHLQSDTAQAVIAEDPGAAPVVIGPSLLSDPLPSEGRHIGEFAVAANDSHAITPPSAGTEGVQPDRGDSDLVPFDGARVEAASSGDVGANALDESSRATPEHNSPKSVETDAGVDAAAGLVVSSSPESPHDPEPSQQSDSLTIALDDTTPEEIDNLTLATDSERVPNNPESEPPEIDDATLQTSAAPIATSDVRPPNEEKPPRSLNPRQYKPATLRPPTPRASGLPGGRPEGSSQAAVTAPVERARSLSVNVRLRFKTSGSARLTLLAPRLEGMPEQLSVTGTHGTEGLIALQDDLFEFEAPADIARILREGVVWLQDDGENSAAWSLAGREIYVLAESRDLGGYVTAPRLVVGDNHVVLCTESRLADTLTALAQVDAASFVSVDETAGLPGGWTGLRNVVPKIPSTTPSSGDILDVLRPVPDIQIVLDGGISLDRSSWLLGYPPAIRIYGDVMHAGGPLIDGKAAIVTEDGSVRVEGWDYIGRHTVSLAGVTRSYSIRQGVEEWASWPAHNWPRTRSHGRALAVCGAAVMSDSMERASRGAQVVPQRDSVLIGAVPGQVHVCSPPGNSAARMCVATPPFDPIWAIPRFPLRCDKTVGRVILLSESAAAPVNSRTRAHPNSTNLREWSRLILEASKRHLGLSSDQRSAADLWAAYRSVARSVWRSTR